MLEVGRATCATATRGGDDDSTIPSASRGAAARSLPLPRRERRHHRRRGHDRLWNAHGAGTSSTAVDLEWEAKYPSC